MAKSSEITFILESIKSLDLIMEKCQKLYGSFVPMMKLLEENKGKIIMEELQIHPNDEVYEAAYQFILKYFEV